jgi:hypothetical protein
MWAFMGDAVWLFFALPNWYFSTIVTPFGAGTLTAIPTLGIVSLVAGVLWGAFKRRLGLLVFLALPAASQGLVVVAGFMRGSLLHGSEPIILGFVLLQIAIAATSSSRSRAQGCRQPRWRSSRRHTRGLPGS